MFLVEEVQKLDRSSRWNYTFQVLNLETRENVEDFTIQAARLPQHRNLNRYRDVLPYDHSRVTLENGSSDYINANLVEVEEIGRKYILAQGPLPDTCGHFWQMVWEQKSPAIVMLNKVIEKNSVKCHPYWPMGEDEELEFSDFQITNISERSANSYVVRDLQLEQISTGDKRSVKQFHYMLWPDFGVPSRPETFLNFLYDIRDSDVFNPKNGPPVIHCSAGIGRSGTFCLVDSILKKAELDGKPDNLNVKEMLLKLRQYRVGLVQTPEQLRFSYLAIIEGIVKLYPELFAFLKEDNEESHKRKISEDAEPPPIPPRKRPPPEKPPRHPISPETNAEQETLKQKKMVKNIQDGIVDDSSTDEEEEEEIINLSESEEDEDLQEVVELYESDEEDRLVDITAVTNKAQTRLDDEEPFPIHKPLPPLPTESSENTKDDDSMSNNTIESVKNELLGSNNTETERDCEGQKSEEENQVSDNDQKLLPLLSLEEEEGDDVEIKTEDENTKLTKEDDNNCQTHSHDDHRLENSIGKISESSKTVDNSEKNITCDSDVAHQSLDSTTNSKPTEDSQQKKNEALSGNKAREETELRQRQRRDEKNKQTAEMVNEIKRKMKEKELTAARWTLTKKSLFALGISGGLLLLYYWFFGKN